MERIKFSGLAILVGIFTLQLNTIVFAGDNEVNLDKIVVTPSRYS